jgi:DNA-binding transcriptional regulator LsrR (DeoR family)
MTPTIDEQRQTSSQMVDRMRSQSKSDPETDVDEAVAGHVARLFFRDQLTKVEIAQRLGISRFRVARLIDASLASGMVTIHFRDSIVLDADLGAALEEQFGLSLGVVVRHCNVDIAEDAGQLGDVAATFLDEMLVSDSVIGVSWGSTTSTLVDRIPRKQTKGVKVVQLCGGSSRISRDSEPLEVARRLSERIGADYLQVLAPVLVSSKSARRELLSQEDIKASTLLWDSLDLAVTGVGAYESAGGRSRAGLVASGIRQDKDVADLRANGAVGELLVYPVRADGTFIEVDPPPIAASVDQLRGTKRVMVVAGGASKGVAIRGALRTGLVTMLVTDDAAAEKMLAQD